MKTYRHGDVFFKQISFLPKNLKKLDTNIVKEGEATGHMHAFTDGGKFEIYQDQQNKLFLQVFEPSPFVHPEHERIIIDPGIYEVEDEQEFDYIEDSLKKVVD